MLGGNTDLAPSSRKMSLAFGYHIQGAVFQDSHALILSGGLVSTVHYGRETGPESRFSTH